MIERSKESGERIQIENERSPEPHTSEKGHDHLPGPQGKTDGKQGWEQTHPAGKDKSFTPPGRVPGSGGQCAPAQIQQNRLANRRRTVAQNDGIQWHNVSVGLQLPKARKSRDRLAATELSRRVPRIDFQPKRHAFQSRFWEVQFELALPECGIPPTQRREQHKKQYTESTQ